MIAFEIDLKIDKLLGMAQVQLRNNQAESIVPNSSALSLYIHTHTADVNKFNKTRMLAAIRYAYPLPGSKTMKLSHFMTFTDDITLFHLF